MVGFLLEGVEVGFGFNQLSRREKARGGDLSGQVPPSSEADGRPSKLCGDSSGEDPWCHTEAVETGLRRNQNRSWLALAAGGDWPEAAEAERGEGVNLICGTEKYSVRSTALLCVPCIAAWQRVYIMCNHLHSVIVIARASQLRDKRLHHCSTLLYHNVHC